MKPSCVLQLESTHIYFIVIQFEFQCELDANMTCRFNIDLCLVSGSETDIESMALIKLINLVLGLGLDLNFILSLIVDMNTNVNVNLSSKCESDFSNEFDRAVLVSLNSPGLWDRCLLRVCPDRRCLSTLSCSPVPADFSVLWLVFVRHIRLLEVQVAIKL